jgi:HAD superfamily hydrolase (TIGR01549 family)
VLFDLDDCLVDYAGAKRRGQALVSASLDGWGLSPERFWIAYSRLEPELFTRFTRGELTVDGYREARYRRPAAACGWALTARQARELNRRYTDAANGGVQAFPGARAALARLRAAGVRLGVLTNGPADGQRRKLAVTGLGAAVDACFISEEIGVAKPDERAFRLALAGLGAEPGRSAMVGDSFATDIEPALRLGLRGVLVGSADAPEGTERAAAIEDVPDTLGFPSAGPARSRA